MVHSGPLEHRIETVDRNVARPRPVGLRRHCPGNSGMLDRAPHHNPLTELNVDTHSYDQLGVSLEELFDRFIHGSPLAVVRALMDGVKKVPRTQGDVSGQVNAERIW